MGTTNLNFLFFMLVLSLSFIRNHLLKVHYIFFGDVNYFLFFLRLDKITVIVISEIGELIFGLLVRLFNVGELCVFLIGAAEENMYDHELRFKLLSSIFHFIIKFSFLVHSPKECFRDRHPCIEVIDLMSLAHPANDLYSMLELVDIHHSSNNLFLSSLTNPI